MAQRTLSTRILNVAMAQILTAGYNNDVSSTLGSVKSSVVLLQGTYASSPSVVLSLSTTGRKNGEIIKLVATGGTFHIMNKTILNGLVASGLATAKGANSADFTMSNSGDGFCQHYLTLVKGESVTLMLSGTSWYVLDVAQHWTVPTRKGYRYNGVAGYNAVSGTFGVTGGVSGTGATIFTGYGTSTSSTFNSKPISTGTTATGSVYLYNGGIVNALSNTGIVAGATNLIEAGFCLSLNALSTSTQTYTARIGMTNNTTGVSTTPIPVITEGFYIEYTNAVNGGSWVLKCVKAGVTTSSNSSIVASISSYIPYKLSYDGVNVVASVNGAYATALSSSAITVGNLVNSLNQTCHFFKTLGTSGSTFDVKGMEFEIYNSQF